MTTPHRGTALFDRLLGFPEPILKTAILPSQRWQLIKVLGATFSIKYERTKSNLPLPRGHELYTYQVKIGKAVGNLWGHFSPITEEAGELPIHCMITLLNDYRDFRDCVNIDEYIIVKQQMDYNTTLVKRQWARCKDAFKFFTDDMKVAPLYVQSIHNRILAGDYTQTELLR